jgi:hypothetical protein
MKIKPTHPLLAFLVLSLLWAGSCKDFLTVEPQDELSREEVFSTIRGARSALAGAYLQLGDGSYYRHQMILYPAMAGLLEPVTRDVSNVSGQFAAINTYVDAYGFNIEADYEDNNLDDLYLSIYGFLYQVNDILDNLPALTDGDPAELASLRGEALFLRALGHFDLLRLFAPPHQGEPAPGLPGIVLRERLPLPLEAPARASLADCYASVLRDLAEARDIVDPAFSRRSGEPVWVTPAVVDALRARVNAYLQRWPAVVDLATSVIDESNKSLSTTANYLSEWENSNLGEMLFEVDVQYLQSSTNSSGVNGAADFIGANNPDASLLVHPDLISLFAADDLRRGLYPENEFGERYSLKYPFETNRITNPPLIRLSELYLLRAEALAAQGEEEAARADYDRIHQRARPTAPPLDLSGAVLLEEIRREQVRELALEGHYLFNLRRWGRDVVRSECLDIVRFCELSYPHPRYTLPIPLDAILRNPNLTQNEGY